MKNLATFDTLPNPTGIAAVSYDSSIFILALLDITQGRVRIHNFNTKESKFAEVHQTPISLLALDFQGKLCATASQLGTVVRVFNCSDMAILYELRRGHSSAQMTSLSFSPALDFLCGTSDHCTLHVWELKEVPPSYVGGLLMTFVNSFKFQPSVAKLRLCQGELKTDPRSRLTGPITYFVSATQIAVAGLDGILHKVDFDVANLTLELNESHSFMEEQVMLRQSMFEPSD
mmetsp:Transcript_3583/g.7699  ORF Transcript_3583/g.7699 Transcript_3583/m.7699 type:complete len:231 (+) Transcript_3583:372-1064(+)